MGICFSQLMATGAENPLLNFNLANMDTHLEKKTWQLSGTVSLGELAVEDHCGQQDRVNIMVAAGNRQEDPGGGRKVEKFLEADFQKVSFSCFAQCHQVS